MQIGRSVAAASRAGVVRREVQVTPAPRAGGDEPHVETEMGEVPAPASERLILAREAGARMSWLCHDGEHKEEPLNFEFSVRNVDQDDRKH